MADHSDIAASMEQLFEGAETTGQKVEALLSKMSLEEKVGQMLQGERYVVTDSDMENLGLGSVLSGGGSYPGTNTLEDWEGMITYLQDGATKNHIPMLYGIDAIHGVGHMYGAVIYPHNIGLGAANDPDLMYQMGAAAAEEMKLMKILWNFSPCVAVSPMENGEFFEIE